MLKSLRLENFTAFTKAHFDFSPGINAFVGDNGTGKTHLLKVAYCLDRAWSDLARKPFAVSQKHAEVYFEERLLSLFQTDALNYLIRRGLTKSRLNAQIDVLMPSLDENERTDTSKTFPLDNRIGPLAWQILLNYEDWLVGAKLNIETFPEIADFNACVPKSVFIPSKEIVLMYEGLTGLLDRYEIRLDATYRDLLPLINSPELKHLPIWFNKVFAQIEDDLGVMKLENTRLVFVTKDEVRTEAPLMAEGFRKLAFLMYLVGHGAIEETDGAIFWDEPEANLNPRFIVKLAKVLVDLASHGIQVNIATHSLFFLKEIDLQIKIAAETSQVPAKFFALSDDGNGVQASSGHSLEEITPLILSDMELEQAYRYNEWIYRSAEKID